MSTPPDDLENMLNEIQKTISDNQRFLQALMDDTGSEESADDDEDEGSTSEEFEEF
jgi:hypothetical protein